MSLQAHLSELSAKHRAIDDKLSEALAHPAASDEEIAALKRKKLRLKDEIARVEAQLSSRH